VAGRAGVAVVTVTIAVLTPGLVGRLRKSCRAAVGAGGDQR
jgi:hypothetical protein